MHGTNHIIMLNPFPFPAIFLSRFPSRRLASSFSSKIRENLGGHMTLGSFNKQAYTETHIRLSHNDAFGDGSDAQVFHIQTTYRNL